MTMASNAIEQRFRVALSFPGERREYVESVAKLLSEKMGSDRVLYDKYYEHEFARPNLDTYLQKLYHDESELIVVFLCSEYVEKDWCGLEWRAIKDLIKRRDVSSIMPLRFDGTEVPGLFSIDGYVSIGSRPPQAIADLILRRLGFPQEQATTDVPLNARSIPVREADDALLDAAVFVEAGNVYWALDGEKRQLTYTGLDESPLLMRDGKHVLFIRNEEYLGHSTKNYRKIILIVNINDYREEILASKKPFEDGLDGTTNILRLEQPTLSLDGRYLYFICEDGAVCSGLMRIDVRTKEWTYVTTAEQFERLAVQPYDGCFILAYSDVRGSGRTIYYKMIDAVGRTMKEFADKSAARQFVKQLQGQPV